MSRSFDREMVLRLLFEIDMGKHDTDQVLSYFFQESQMDTESKNFIEERVYGTIAHQSEIDEIIKEHTIDWEIDRLANIDKIILRMAIFEMDFIEDIPEVVTINESIELAKKYGTGSSGKFINGVLGKYYNFAEKRLNRE